MLRRRWSLRSRRHRRAERPCPVNRPGPLLRRRVPHPRRVVRRPRRPAPRAPPGPASPPRHSPQGHSPQGHSPQGHSLPGHSLLHPWHLRQRHLRQQRLGQQHLRAHPHRGHPRRGTLGGTLGGAVLGHVIGPGGLRFGLRGELGLGGELVGPHVVPLGVVGMLAERLAVLLGDLAPFSRLLDRQADTTTLEVDVDDLDPQLFARGHDLLRQVHMVTGHLRDMDEALDAVTHLHERTERHQLGDASVDQFTDLVRVGEFLPRIGLGGLQREADPLLGEVHIEHLDIDLVAHRHHRRGVVDVLPRELGHMDQPVHSPQIHESPEVDHRGHHAPSTLARLEVEKELAALFLLRLLEPGPTGQDHVVAIPVELDDLGIDGLSHIGLELAHPTQLDQ